MKESAGLTVLGRLGFHGRQSAGVVMLDMEVLDTAQLQQLKNNFCRAAHERAKMVEVGGETKKQSRKEINLTVV